MKSSHRIIGALTLGITSACADPSNLIVEQAASQQHSAAFAATSSVSSSLILPPSTNYLKVGGSVELLTTQVLDKRRVVVTNWTSRNTQVLKVGARTGAVSASKVGAGWIVASSGATTDSVLLYVISSTAPKLSHSQASIEQGSELQVTTTETYPLAWVSLDTSVAKVTSSGLITAMRAGAAVIVATSPVGAASSVQVTVTQQATTPPPTTPPPTTPPPTTPPPTTPPPTTPPPTASALNVELPQIYLDGLVSGARSASPTRTINVANSAAFQAALDTSKFGDVIVLTAGTTYTGPFVLRKKSGAGWVTIRSNSSSLPAAGVRIRPSQASQLPKIVSQWPMEPAIRTEAGANGYHLLGLEVTAVSSATQAGALVALGSGDNTQSTLASVPFNLVLDRVFVHGTSTLNFQRCIALNSGATAIVDSWISDCHGKGFDSQAIGGWNGTGPYKIVNNMLEGAGENVMFGGADPSIQNLLPSDIEFRRNHVFKPMSWKGVWSVKNSFELKIGKRILVEGNIFENNWADAQVGFAILLKSTNQSGSAPWSQTADVTFQYNVIKNSHFGLAMAGRPEYYPAVPAARIRIAHNSFEALSDAARVIQTSGIQGVSIENNAGFGGFVGFIMHDEAHTNFTAINNIFGTSTNFVTSADGKGVGTSALNWHAGSNWVFQRNVIVGATAATYPTDNFYPALPSLVGLAGYPSNLELLPTSPYYTAGTDGKPVGPNYTYLRSLTNGVVIAP